LAEKPEPQEVLKRLGDDLRDAVDMAGEALSKALMGLGAAVRDVGGGALPSAAAPELAGPGHTVTTSVRLRNDSTDSTRPFGLTPVDLVSPDGERIPAAAVEVAAGTQVIPGRGTATVVVTVSVPAETKPGVYSGRLDSAGVPVGNAQVVVEVG
jgi:hypothetical protein